MANDTDWAETTEQRVLDEALKLVPTQGWTRPMAHAAGRAAGLSAPETDLLLPHGPADLAALLSRRHDAADRPRTDDLLARQPHDSQAEHGPPSAGAGIIDH